MLARLAYWLRETRASFQRNMTLTIASILTAAVALFLAGTTFLIQKAFNNLLVQWQDDVEMIVFVKEGATEEQLALIQSEILSLNITTPEGLTYLPPAEALEQARIVLAGQPDSVRNSFTEQNIPTQFRIKPIPGADDQLIDARGQLQAVNHVHDVVLAADILDVYRSLSGFVRVVTLVASVVLLAIAVLLIWNTIRTAMFARRREIEVMKLVGATDWFIRIPFMMEGLVQGLIGGTAASASLFGVNSLWGGRLAQFADSKSSAGTSIAALQVSGGYVQGVAIMLLVIGMLAGAIGAGVASSKFLDV